MTEAPDWVTSTPSTPAIHTEPTQAGGQFTTPFTPAKLLQLGTQLIEQLLSKVVAAIVGIFIPGGGTAFAQLSNWATVLLPAQILQPIEDLVAALVALIGPIPIIGPVIDNLANFLGLTHDTANTATDIGENAQYSADTANAGVALLNAKLAGTGTVFTDTFNRASASNLGSDYDRSMGSGSGTWGTDGSGNAVWTTGGSTNQVCLDRCTTALTTKYQSIVTVLTTPPGAGQFGDNARIKLALRMNSAKNTYVVAVVDAGLVEIGYVNSGSYTRLGATAAVTQANGDLWEFRAGTATDDYELVLLQNNLTVCDRLDAGHSSQAGSASSGWVGTYDYGGLIANAGTVQFGFFTFQLAAPTVQVLTITDRTP